MPGQPESSRGTLRAFQTDRAACSHKEQTVKRNRLASILLMAALILSACGSTPPPPPPTVTSSPALPGTITIGQPVRELPTAFLGFNLELSSVCSVLDQDTANTGEYERLYTAIGP